MFEITKRDGLARLGKFETKSGIVLETPALLPVVNPKIFTVTPKELYEEFGFRALITNSYIIKNNPALKEKAQAEGLHKMLDFPGVIMTDSGTFQSHMYGEVEVTNDEMVEFQKVSAPISVPSSTYSQNRSGPKRRPLIRSRRLSRGHSTHATSKEI